MNIPNKVKKLKQLFTEKGAELYLVGGCVRDYLMNRRIKDYDLATNITPDKVIEILESNNLRCDKIGAHFGVVIYDKFEIATFREDVKYNDNRKAEVEFNVTMEEDANRRDFTINAMYMDIDTQKIYDFFGGQNDIKNKVLKAVGDPYLRFEEDHLRKLRAIRFAIRYDFTIEEKTLQAIKDSPKLNIAKERVFNELVNMSKKSSPKLFPILHETGLDKEIFNQSIGTYFNDKLSFEELLAINVKFNTNFIYELKFTKDMVNNVMFLQNMETRLNENFIKYLNILKKYNLEHLLIIADQLNMDTDFIEKCYNYKLKVTVANIIKQGYKGVDINIQLNKQNLDLIKDI